MIPGREITLGDRTYTVPPANWNAQLKHKAFLDRMTKAVNAGEAPESFGFTDFEAMFDLGFLALKRNYPELTPEQLGEHVDNVNIVLLFRAAMNAPEAAAGE